MSQDETLFERVAATGEIDRSRQSARRRLVESILESARFVLPDDQILLRQAFEFGLSISDIARLLRSNRNTIYRRIRAIVARIRSPLFAYAAKHRRAFDPTLRQIADIVVLQGQGQREASLATGLSLHQVRKHLYALAALAGR